MKVNMSGSFDVKIDSIPRYLKTLNLLKTIFSKNNTIIVLLSFFLGRVKLAGSLMPFGFPLLVSTFNVKTNRLLVIICITASMLAGGAGEQFYVFFCASVLFFAVKLVTENMNIQLAGIWEGLTVGACVFLPEIMIIMFEGFLLYDFLLALFHGFIAFTMMFVFKKASFLFNENLRKKVLTTEETISVAIIAAIILSGLSSLDVFGFSIKNVISIFILMAFSNKYGAGVGAAAGVTFGLVSGMPLDAIPVLTSCYAFCGLLSGLFSRLGKGGTIIGFIMGNAILTLYLNGSTQVIIHIKDIAAASAIFLGIPRKHLNSLTSPFGRKALFIDKRSHSARIKEITVDRLKSFATAFREMGKTFSEISQTKVSPSKQDISLLFDRVAEKVCSHCSMSPHCWDRNFYDTYQVLFRIIEVLDRNGRIGQEDIPPYFLKRCARLKNFIEETNNIYEIFKVDLLWKKKIGESRALVSKQMEGLSKIIENLASELNTDISFETEMEDKIFINLARAGFKVEEVAVFINGEGKYEINVRHKSCGGMRICHSGMEALLSGLLGKPVSREGTGCMISGKRNMCSLKFLEEETFQVTTAVAAMAKSQNKVSGDSYSFVNTGKGKYLIALSDGMGSGENAAKQSKATVSFIELFMEAGFDKDTAVNLVNSMLLLKSTDDSFATIDLTVIDLYSGEAEFIKIGAVHTYIKMDENVESVRSLSLPAGLMDDVEMNFEGKKLQSGHLIIMMSDGVFDSFVDDKADAHKNLQKFISEIDSINPQTVADTILDRAYHNYEGAVRDDMTVIVSKVWKKV